MLYRTIWLLLDSVHRLVCGNFTKDHNISETGSISILRWIGPMIETSSFWQAQLSRSTLPHPPEDGDRFSLQNVVVFCKTSTYQTMDRVQKKPNSSVHGLTCHTLCVEVFWSLSSSLSLSLSFFFLLLPLWSIGHLWNALFHFSLLILGQLVGLLGWGISLLQGRYLHKHRHTSVPWAGFEPMIKVFKQAKTVCALDCMATVISSFLG
jgi:hypothetical protein